LILECLIDCAFCVLRPLLVVLEPEYRIRIQLDSDHFRTSNNHLLSVFASAATLTPARLFVVYFNSKLLVLLRSFIHAILLFFLPHFHLLLKQHVKRLLDITATAAVVI